jgi:peroxin-1
MSEKRKARLYFGRHNDCFVHGLVKEWQSWLKLSTGVADQLRLVRIVFPTNFCLIANFSTRPALPSGAKHKNSIEREYIEIDPEYGKCLYIKEGQLVSIECIPELMLCRSIAVAPVDVVHYEILEYNKDKICTDMLNQVRVVSSSHSFPIWLNNQPIILKTLQIDPNDSKWVLLVKNTAVNLQLYIPDSSFAEDDTISPPEEHNKTMKRSVSRDDISKNTRTHRSSKSDTGVLRCYTNPNDISPSQENADNYHEEEDEHYSSKFLSFFTNLLPRKSPESEQNNRLVKTPLEGEPKLGHHRPLSQSFSVGHVKERSWHGQTEHERIKRSYLPLITPPCHVTLRVQAVDPDYLSYLWNVDNCFDIFVHPFSVPDLHHISPSHLVKLCLFNPASLHKKLITNDVKQPPQDSSFSSVSSTPSNPTSTDSEPQSFLNRLLTNYITEQSDHVAIPTPPLTSSTPTSADHQTFPYHQCRYVVAHLLITNTVQFKSRLRRTSYTAIEESSLSREGSISPAHGGSPLTKIHEQTNHVSIIPGHIVMSDLMRQLLGAEISSLVVLEHLPEAWRVNCRMSKVSITLKPLEPVQNVKSIISGFRNLVNMCDKQDYSLGCFFSDSMILPIPLQTKANLSSDMVHCSVSYKAERYFAKDPASKSSLRFFQIYPIDIKSDNFEKVEIKVSSPQHNEKRLIPIDKLQASPAPDINIQQFGGFTDVFTECYHYLMSAFSQSGNGALLICGTGGGGANGAISGCGKTSLANLLCKSMSASLWRFRVEYINCTMLRGKRLDSVKKKLKEIVSIIKETQPVILVLDDLDKIAGHITDVQQEAAGESIVNSKNAHLILNFLMDVRVHQCMVIATSSTKKLLHPSLLHSKGRHVFRVVEIKPPNLSQREDILNALLRNVDSRIQHELSSDDKRNVALQTEGFQAKDIAILMDRAVNSAEQRKIKQVITATRKFENYNFYERDSTIGASWSSQFPIILNIIDFQTALDSYKPAALKGMSLHSKGGVTFKNVGGLEDIKQTLQETLLWPSKYPKLFEACPIKQHAGLLLYGAPGTGKTLLAEAVANEFNLNFVSIKGPELLNKYIGASEQAIRDLFARASAATPCVLFFDEFDSMAPRRGHDRTGVTDRVVNQLLTELDGVESSQGVYILAASSRPDLIDPALLRPGRIDKILCCEIPADEIQRKQILIALSHNIPISSDVRFDNIAAATSQFTGADMKALLYNAQLLAVNRMLSNLQSSADNEIKVTAGSQQVDDETFDMGSEAHSHTGKAHAHTRKFDVWQFSKDTQTNIINPVRTDPVGSSMVR